MIRWDGESGNVVSKLVRQKTSDGKEKFQAWPSFRCLPRCARTKRRNSSNCAFPKTPEEHAEVGEVVRQTAGFVLDLRGAFDKQFQAFEAGSPNMQRHTKEPLRPNFIGISDSLVTSVPLRNDGGDLVGIVTVYSALSAAAVVMLMSLASKHPLRGGIDVGLAVEMGPQEVYGTALARASHLESTEAQYPRIVIGDELWRYFNAAIVEFEKQVTPVITFAFTVLQSYPIRVQPLVSAQAANRRMTFGHLA